MKSYTEAALNFAHALINLSTRVEVFSLGTELTRLTVALKPRAKAQALSNVYQLVDDFDGGTNLGETLSLLLNNPRHAGFARVAVVISISDGLSGNSEALLVLLANSIHWRLLTWLTPLADKEHFIPKTEALNVLTICRRIWLSYFLLIFVLIFWAHLLLRRPHKLYDTFIF